MSTFTTAQIRSVYDLDDPSIQDLHRPGLSAMFVVAADILGLSLALWAFFGNTTLGRYAVPDGWLRLWFLLPIFPVIYWLFDSYPGVSVNSVDEIRRISLANASIFLFISAMFAMHHPALAPQLICLSACVCASVVTLTARGLIRQFGSRFEWWGYPVVLFGGEEVALSVARKLMDQPHLGLRPVALVSDKVANRPIEGIPVFESQNLAQLASSGVRHAIVAAPELSQSEFAEVLERSGDIFPHLILIPDTDFIWKTGAYTRDLMGILGIQVRNNLLDKGSRIVKRTIDLASSVLLALFLLPLLVMIPLLIAVESGFPVFYFQKRLGHGGRTFHMWKFRTMAHNSKTVLEHHLASDPEQKKEWIQFQKLRFDPRVTRVGRVLRRTSLDELPQLWNIIKGEMSLVGPRPYLATQLTQHHSAYSAYVKTTPGLTGLWQVSGRNRTTLAERIAYDIYYIRNWSVWLDIYLLAKTVRAVLTGDGAY